MYLLNFRNCYSRTFKIKTLTGLVLLVFFLVMGFVASASAVPVTVNSSLVYADAYDGIGSYTRIEDTSTAIPTSVTLAATDGANTAITSLDWYGYEEAAVFNFAFDHIRDGTHHSRARSDAGFTFTANQNTTYLLTGDYTLSGNNRLFYSVELIDLSSGENIFQNYQLSNITQDESFLIGGEGGDSSNSLFGTTTGNIIAGHDYRFAYSAYTRAYSSADSGASAEGFVNLTIGTPIPEPATMILLGTGLLGLAGIRRKMKS